MNPIDDYLEAKNEKTASRLSSFGRGVGSAAATGLGTAVAGAGVAAAGMAASKLYDAVTKARDFRAMMASPFNADLHEVHRDRPKEFNEVFSTLRAVAPEFSRNPMVAGTYVRRAMSFDPSSAGGVMREALEARDKIPESPMSAAFFRGGQGGADAGMRSHMSDEANKNRDTLKDQQDVMRMALQQEFKRKERDPSTPPEYFRDIAVGKSFP